MTRATLKDYVDKIPNAPSVVIPKDHPALRFFNVDNPETALDHAFVLASVENEDGSRTVYTDLYRRFVTVQVEEEAFHALSGVVKGGDA